MTFQLKILEEGLINQPVMGYGESGRKASDLRILFAKIEESEVSICYWFKFNRTGILENTFLQYPLGNYSFVINLLCYEPVFLDVKKLQFRPTSGDVQRMECLKALREIAIPLAERPARGDLTGEVCHWADGYHLNVKIYEKLLLSVFDILDEGKLTEVIHLRFRSLCF